MHALVLLILSSSNVYEIYERDVLHCIFTHLYSIAPDAEKHL